MVANIPISSAAIADFCRRWGLVELSLFGSVLRNDFRPESDVDVLVVFSPGKSLDWDQWLAMEDELSAMFGGRRIDLVERQCLTNPFRRREILLNRRVLYAA